MLTSIKNWDSNYPNGYIARGARREYTQRLAKLIRKYSKIGRENSRVPALRETLEECLHSLADAGELDYKTRDVCGLSDW